MSKGVISYGSMAARDEANSNPRLKELLAMLTYARPAGSGSEAKFINRFIIPLGVQVDGYGNYWKDVEDQDGNVPPILFSCHTDTVHRSSGKQRIAYCEGLVGVSGNTCLGADDTAGVWLMTNMICSGVPGRYVFHREEECGGNGSAHVRDKQPELLAGVKYAIAFDRRGYTEIITHQGSTRCASDAFGNSLIEMLKPMQYQLSTGGSFTDTANYKRIVPECANIGVGYFDAHSSKETLDCTFLQVLLDQLCSADWSKLVCERDPKKFEYLSGSYGYYGNRQYSYGGSSSGGGGFTDWDTEDEDWAAYTRGRRTSAPTTGALVEQKKDSPFLKLVEYIKQYPYDVATFLLALGFEQPEIEEAIWEARRSLTGKERNGGAGEVIDLTKDSPASYVKCDDCGTAFYTKLDGAPQCPQCDSHSVTSAQLPPRDQQLTVQSPGEAESNFHKEIEAEKARLKQQLKAQVLSGKLSEKDYDDAVAALEDLQTSVT